MLMWGKPDTYMIHIWMIHYWYISFPYSPSIVEEERKPTLQNRAGHSSGYNRPALYALFLPGLPCTDNSDTTSNYHMTISVLFLTHCPSAIRIISWSLPSRATNVRTNIFLRFSPHQHIPHILPTMDESFRIRIRKRYVSIFSPRFFPHQHNSHILPTMDESFIRRIRKIFVSTFSPGFPHINISPTFSPQWMSHLEGE